MRDMPGRVEDAAGTFICNAVYRQADTSPQGGTDVSRKAEGAVGPVLFSALSAGHTVHFDTESEVRFPYRPGSSYRLVVDGVQIDFGMAQSDAEGLHHFIDRINQPVRRKD